MSTAWFPARLFQKESHNKEHDSALIILNQPLRDQKILATLWNLCKFHVAADGGANALRAALLGSDDDSLITAVKSNPLDAIIGDLDSLTTESRSYFETEFAKPPAVIEDGNQYATDFDKAVGLIHKRMPSSTDIVAMGGLGGRVDQGLSQLHHLYKYQRDVDRSNGRIYLVSEESLTFMLKAGDHDIHVREAGLEDVFIKYVGIVPFKGPCQITTEGLEWDVTDWATEIGGQVSTSNHVLPETQVVRVKTTGDVIFTIALKV